MGAAEEGVEVAFCGKISAGVLVDGVFGLVASAEGDVIGGCASVFGEVVSVFGGLGAKRSASGGAGGVAEVDTPEEGAAERRLC